MDEEKNEQEHEELIETEPETGAVEAAPEQPAAEEAPSLEAQLADSKDRYLRLLAEFDNYKKRVLKERSELLKYQGENIVFDLLEVLDNLERAQQHLEADVDKLREGFELIYRRFVDILQKWDIRGESAKGQPFDPQLQQAISTVAVAGVEPNTVFEEFKKAYFYKDKLLRPAQVIVATALEQPAEDNGGDDEKPFDA